MSFFGGSGGGGGGGFSFGGGGGNKGGFSFPASTTASNTTTTASATTGGGLFANASTSALTSSAAGSFSFGGGGGGSGLFGNKSATQLNLGAPKVLLGNTSQSASGGLFTSSGNTTVAATGQTAVAPSFNFAPQTTSGGLFLSGNTTVAATGQTAVAPSFSFAPQSTAASTQAQSTGFSLGKSFSTPLIASSAGSSTGGFSLGISPLAATSKTTTTTASTTTKASTLALGQTSTTSSSGGLSFGAKTNTVSLGSAGLFNTNKTASASAPSKIAVSSSAAPVISSSAAATSTSQTNSSAANTTTASNTFTFSDLESKVNKWTSELEQQEKLFLTQATHVNAWNKVLNENAVQITKLNEEFIKVEEDQKHLNQELDYLKKQQQELDELLKPMEDTMRQETSSLSCNIHTHHADLERERTYNMMETIDGQMKGMLQDLREVIDHINASSETSDTNNPINQVGKILSAHMDSLQWLDGNSQELQEKVQELTNHVETLKREGNFHLAFNKAI